MNQTVLQNAERVAQAQSQQPVETVAQPCPLAEERFAIEVIIVGEDDQPRSGEKVELAQSASKVNRTTTNAKGLVRFDGLEEGDYQVSLYDLDQDTWEHLETTPLGTDQAQSQGSLAWSQPPSAPAAQASTFTVEQGDCLATIADHHGLFPETLSNHSGNQALKQLRGTLYILKPGDVVEIPAKRFTSIPVATGNRYRIRRKGVPEILRKCFLDYNRDPRAGIPYLLKLETAGGDSIKDTQGQTDRDGFLTEYIPPDATVALVTLNPGPDQEQFHFNLGYLDPLSEPRGIQARLNNLGFNCGAEDGHIGEKTRLAIQRFQWAYDLEATGMVDEEFKNALLMQHQS